MKKAVAIIMVLMFASVIFAAQGTKWSADEAWTKLDKGNKRYRTGVMRGNKYRGEKRRLLAAKGQKPFAVILTCSDSRVPPEIIFDAGIGDLFVIRNAGNVVDDETLGSIEYAVNHLGVKLIVVLGHERCGAMMAALEEGLPEGHIRSITDRLELPVARAKQEKKGKLLDNAIMINITSVVKEIANSEPILKEKVMAGKIKVIGAYYDLDTGKVHGVKE